MLYPWGGGPRRPAITEGYGHGEADMRISVIVPVILPALIGVAFCHAADTKKPAAKAAAPRRLRFEGWKKLTDRDMPPTAKMTDVAAAGDHIFAVSSHGGFYHILGGQLRRLSTPLGQPLQVVWAKGPREVYAAGKGGTVLFYDGKTVRPLGKPVGTVKRRYHPSVAPRDTPVEPTHVWASSSKDVYVAARKGALLHYDGTQWREVDLGPVEAIVPDRSELGAHVVHAVVGPVWGQSPQKVWVGRSKLPSGARRPRELFRGGKLPSRQPLRAGLQVWHFDGKQWRTLGTTLPWEPFDNLGRSPYHPEVLRSGDGHVTRFDNAIHRWCEDKWQLVAKLPPVRAGARAWSHWTAAAGNTFLIKAGSWGVYAGGEWVGEPVSSPGVGGSERKIALADDGTVAMLNHAGANFVYLGRIDLKLARTIALSTPAAAPTGGEVVHLWPESVLGPEAVKSAEKISVHAKGDGKITKITNVTNPTITICKPTKAADTGAAVIVCPGGGYGILAYDLEGTEIVEWLNGLGVTGIILKYRVPRQRDAAFKDAQRAVSIVRSRAAAWKIDPKRIGILGFSAGGHLAARACTNFKKRSYEAVDKHDEAACRPDFAVLIYPAYLGTAALDRAALPVATDTPSTFIAIAFNDKFTVGALHYFAALKQATVRSELHVYQFGGHGCGLRKTDANMTTWPQHCARWLRGLKVIK